jgi:hypothetical protein
VERIALEEYGVLLRVQVADQDQRGVGVVQQPLLVEVVAEDVDRDPLLVGAAGIDVSVVAVLRTELLRECVHDHSRALEQRLHRRGDQTGVDGEHDVLRVDFPQTGQKDLEITPNRVPS